MRLKLMLGGCMPKVRAAAARHASPNMLLQHRLVAATWQSCNQEDMHADSAHCLIV